MQSDAPISSNPFSLATVVVGELLESDEVPAESFDPEPLLSLELPQAIASAEQKTMMIVFFMRKFEWLSEKIK